MTRAWTIALYATSFAAHALLAAGVGAIREPEPPPAPVHIVVRDVQRPPRAEEPPPPPPPPPEPPPVADAPRPRPQTPPPDAPPPPPAPPVAAVPDFGLALAGGVGVGGTAVPVGDPHAAPRAPEERIARTAERRELEAPTHAGRVEEPDTCVEAAVRPRPIEMPRPQYTEAARAAGLEGRVRVEVHLAADGSIEEVRVVASLDPGLDEAAVVAVRAASFTAQTRCGVAEPTTFTIGVSFTL